ncbi:replicative DNA helicase [uncultured Mediterranean phage uvDeep-CGR2-KM19-C269]|nr:replicative DNA helicase [uncultured Mediterranean phage uvDeep-CGR2-KM19-C269]
MNNYIPINDNLIEKLVLKYLMFNANMYYNNSFSRLTKNSFYSINNQLIYEEIKEQFEANGYTTRENLYMTLISSSVNKKELNDIMAGTNEDIMQDSDFELKCVMLKELEIRRNVSKAMIESLPKLQRTDIDVFETIDSLNSAVESNEVTDSNEIGFAEDYINDTLIHIKDRMDNPEIEEYIESGLRMLDRNLNGWSMNGELIVVGGRTGMGKTMFCLNLNCHAVSKGYKSLFASVEMDRRELTYRMFANLGDLESYKINTPKFLTKDEYSNLVDNVKPMLDSNNAILDKGGVSLEDIKREARKLHRTSGLDIIFVDYIQKLKVKNPDYKRATTVEKIGYITGELKSLSQELKLPIIAAAQLNRDSAKEGAKPQLHDLKGSGDIEQDANKVILLHRPAYYNGDTTNPHTEIIVAKNRNGQNFTATADFFGAKAQFRNQETDSKVIENPNKDINRVTTQTMLDA